MARRTAALVANMRPALPAAMLSRPGADADNVVALPNPGLPPRDGATRVGGFAAMDAQNRVCIAKAATALGWDDQTALVVVCELGRITVAEGSPQHRRDTTAKYADGRLTLSRAARGCLGLTTGDQVVLATAPSGGAMVLMAGADVLQMLTGPAPAATCADLSGLASTG